MTLLADIDECKGRNGKRLCPSDKNCVNKPGTFICVCKEGYRQLRNGICKGSPAIANNVDVIFIA